eukprot:scaffold11797_cov64-Phaeocystis_antarctica.AAC.1
MPLGPVAPCERQLAQPAGGGAQRHQQAVKVRREPARPAAAHQLPHNAAPHAFEHRGAERTLVPVGVALEEAVHARDGVAGVAAAGLDLDQPLERDLQLDDVPRGEAAQVEQQVAVAAAHAGVKGEHEPVLDEQHCKARVRAEHLEHSLDVLERLALDRP